MKLGDPLAPENESKASKADGVPVIRFPAEHGQEFGRHGDDPKRRMLTRNSRRHFLRGASATLGALALWFMNRLVRRSDSVPENSETSVAVPWTSAPGIHFYNRIIVVNSPQEVAVFSATCTHLGCRINCTESAELVCPCHGSRFNMQGEVTHGPAGRPLRALPFQLDRANGRLHVSLESSQT